MGYLVTMLAATKLSRFAVGDRTMVPARVTCRAASNLAQDKHIEGLPLGTRGGVQKADKKDYNFSSLVLGVVSSAPFQQKAKTAAPAA